MSKPRSSVSRLTRPEVGSPALYRRVKDHVARLISSGELEPGDRVPSELDLVRQFGISRMTVNRALRELADEGFVTRVSGSGTFVAPKAARSEMLRIESIGEEIRARGERYSFDMISVARKNAGMDVALVLELTIDTPFFHSVCLHRADGVPVQIEDRCVSIQLAPDYLDQPFTSVSPGDYLYANVALTEIEHVVEASTPSRAERELLQLRDAEPCLVILRRTWSNGVPATYSRLVHPGSRFRLGSRFQVRPSPPSTR